MTAELRTKSIHAPVEKSDGLRISVMSRHTLNDGITPDPQITSESYSLWIKELAPPKKLIGDYYKRDLEWEVFEERYIDFLQNRLQQIQINRLIGIATRQVTTILCVEETPEHCHRRLLAEECKRINQNLILTVK